MDSCSARFIPNGEYYIYDRWIQIWSICYVLLSCSLHREENISASLLWSSHEELGVLKLFNVFLYGVDANMWEIPQNHALRVPETPGLPTHVSGNEVWPGLMRSCVCCLFCASLRLTVTSPTCSWISQFWREAPVLHLSFLATNVVVWSWQMRWNRAKSGRAILLRACLGSGRALQEAAACGCRLCSKQPPGKATADPRGCQGNQHLFPLVSPWLIVLHSEPPCSCCWLGWSSDAEWRFLACDMIIEMDGTKSFKKWRRSLLPEDFNFALSIRGAESDVIKRELEIVQR